MNTQEKDLDTIRYLLDGLPAGTFAGVAARSGQAAPDRSQGQPRAYDLYQLLADRIQHSQPGQPSPAQRGSPV